MRTRVAIGVAGAIGLAVLARTAAYYQRQDGLALGLVAVMAAAFVYGLVELLARAARAERLARELASLPTPATDAAIDGASAPLRALLRARVARGSVGAPASLAPYLVGLLVMLGLLGTFLGLFETLRGAREALTTSGDVDALRAGLAAPMQGLTRSFGTSAAGVSTSAMLGLAATFARGIEARFAARLQAYAAVALAPLTVEHRQLAALEKIARQGEALPEATVLLRDAAARLGALETSWARAHAEATERTTRAHVAAAESAARAHAEATVSAARAHADATEATARAYAEATARTERALAAAVESVRGELATAIARSARAVSDVVTPLAERAVDGAVGAATRHVAEVRAELESDREARRAADAAREARAEEQTAQVAARDDARAQAIAAREDARTEASAARDEARAQAMVAREDARAAQLASQWSEATAALRASVGAATQALADAARGQAARDDARDRALTETADRVAQATAKAIDAASRRMVAAGDRDEARGAALEKLVAVTGAHGDAVAASARAQAASVDAMLAAIDARGRDLDTRAQDERAAFLASLDEARVAGAARAAALEAEIARAHATYVAQLADRLGAHAEAAQAGVARSAEVVQEAASLVHAGGAELGAVAAMFAGAVDRQRDAAAAWLESLGAVEAAVEQAGDALAARGLGEQLDRARELFDVQLQFHRELLLQLRATARANEAAVVAAPEPERASLADDAVV